MQNQVTFASGVLATWLVMEGTIAYAGRSSFAYSCVIVTLAAFAIYSQFVVRSNVAGKLVNALKIACTGLIVYVHLHPSFRLDEPATNVLTVLMIAAVVVGSVQLGLETLSRLFSCQEEDVLLRSFTHGFALASPLLFFLYEIVLN